MTYSAIGAIGARKNGRHLGLALLVIATAQLMVVLDATVVNVALPAGPGVRPATRVHLLNGVAD